MKDIHNYIKRGRAPLCDLLKELVSIPTVNPPGTHYAEIVDVLQEKCKALGMQTQIAHVPQAEAQAVVPHADAYPRLNLISRWDVGAEKTVHFNAHYDVVPVSGNWRMDAFQPQVVGNWLYGRGADDMKDSIAALLFAVTAIRENGVQPAFNIEFSFTCDEEIGGDLGAGYIVRKGLVQADFVVNCEGGSVLNVGVGHNGVLWLDVAVHGVAAHAAQPEKGINAFEKMADLVAGLQPLKQQLKAPERVFKTPAGHERYPTINLGGVFHGTDGDKINTVPAQANFSIDRRILPNERLASAEQELRAAIRNTSQADSDLKVDVNSILRIEPCVVESEHPFPQAFAQAVRTVRRHPIKLSTTSGFTDLHFFVEDGGMPGVGYGPNGKGAHGANERVNIPDLMQTAKVYATFMTTPFVAD
ncbi:MAG: ArgE/DapE family deacylase [Candidatus Poribacteria bacterium]|nr:ArgE/DapE family deacylase [Candidatus Poribacteria bacterium]